MGPTQAHALRPPDLHKLTEGLLLSAWSHWEEFCRDLVIEDLTSRPSSCLRREIRNFRTKKAPIRLAERIVNHPDHPDRFIEWHNYEHLRDRATALLGLAHRYVALGNPYAPDLTTILTLRNAVAHKSDKAKEGFVRIITQPPFSLSPASRKGITVGRFISSHNWGKSGRVVLHAIETIRACTTILVP
jgi:hypothetical protein